MEIFGTDIRKNSNRQIECKIQSINSDGTIKTDDDNETQ